MAALRLIRIVSLGLVGWAIWVDTWQAGLTEIVVIIGVVLFERMIARALTGG